MFKIKQFLNEDKTENIIKNDGKVDYKNDRKIDDEKDGKNDHKNDRKIDDEKDGKIDHKNDEKVDHIIDVKNDDDEDAKIDIESECNIDIEKDEISNKMVRKLKEKNDIEVGLSKCDNPNKYSDQEILDEFKMIEYSLLENDDFKGVENEKYDNLDASASFKKKFEKEKRFYR